MKFIFLKDYVYLLDLNSVACKLYVSSIHGHTASEFASEIHCQVITWKFLILDEFNVWLGKIENKQSGISTCFSFRTGL